MIKEKRYLSSLELAQSLDFNTVFDLHCYLIDCYLNGNITASRRLFNELRKNDKKDFIMFLSHEFFNTDTYKFYFNLL